jgi:hypothetical protein
MVEAGIIHERRVLLHHGIFKLNEIIAPLMIVRSELVKMMVL